MSANGESQNAVKEPATPTPGKNDNKVAETAGDKGKDQENPLGTSKDQRRRLKKLHKRAANLCSQTDLSGICIRTEWEEVKETAALMKLHPNEGDAEYEPEDYAPWIGMRQTKRHLKERDKNRDGFDHRYTLKYILHSQQPTPATTPASDNDKNVSSRKRPRKEESNLAIPTWFCLHNPVCVDHVAVLEVHLSDKVKREEVESMAKTALDANNYYPTKWFEGPRPQSMSDVLLYEKPVLPSRKKAKEIDLSQEEGHQQLRKELVSLVLSPEELDKEGYPMPAAKKKEEAPSTTITKDFRKPTSFSLEEAKGVVEPTHANVADQKFPFVTTSSASTDTNESTPRVFGLDCEMVKTKDGTELGRVTLIEYNPTTTATSDKEFPENFRILMDELVRPYPPILDYVTAYSGITAELLKDVSTRLEQVQAAVLTYVQPHDILVGHSLENDLMAMRWIHPTVIDTAILFRTDGSFKYSLKHLSNVLLHKRIQDGASHCSEEDASATLELAVRRAQKGPGFAIAPPNKKWWIPTSSTSSTDAAMVFVGPARWLSDNVTRQPNAIHALACDNVDHPNTKAILSWLTGPRRRAGLVWANLVLSETEHLKSLETLLSNIKAKMSMNTVLTVNIQPGHSIAADTSQRRRACKNPKSTLSWSEEDEQHCRGLVDTCRFGSVFWVSKHPGPGKKKAKHYNKQAWGK